MTARRAPYLAGLPSLDENALAALSSKRPSPAELARARRTIARLRVIIRRARELHELRIGRTIYISPPATGD